MGYARKAVTIAWRLMVNDLVGSYGRAGLSAIIAVLASLASYVAMRRLGPEDALGELLPIVMGPLVLLTVGLVGFLVNWICRVPYKQWAEVAERGADLERRLRPTLSVLTATNHRAAPIAYGRTTVSLGGTRQVVIGHGPNHTLRLDVTNESATPIIGCEAYLVRFESFDKEAEPAAWFSLRLPWLQTGNLDQGGVNIPPHGVRAIALFRVINNRVHLLQDDGVPVHMVNAIKEYGEYSGLVTITSQNAPTAHVAFTLSCNGSEVHPLLNVERGSPFDDDEGLFFARTSGL